MPWFGSIFFLHVAHCWAGASKARTTEYWVLSTDSRFHLSSTGFWVQHQRLDKRLVNWLRCSFVLMNCTVCFASTRLHAKEQWQTVGWMWRAHLWLWTLRLYECLFGVCFEKIRSLAIFSWESLSRYHLSQSKAWCWSGPTQDWQLLWNCLFQLRMNCSNVCWHLYLQKRRPGRSWISAQCLLLPRQKSGSTTVLLLWHIFLSRHVTTNFFGQKRSYIGRTR